MDCRDSACTSDKDMELANAYQGDIILIEQHDLRCAHHALHKVQGLRRVGRRKCYDLREQSCCDAQLST